MEERQAIKLKTKHMFRILSIAKKTGFTEQAKVLFTGIDIKGLSKEEIAIKEAASSADLMMSVIENFDLVEHELYELIADIAGKTPDEVANEDPLETMDTLKQIFESETIKGFLKQATV